jgi:DNA-binding NarL/FixJ family response regulator
MTALTHDHPTSVMLIGPDATVLEAVSRLLVLDVSMNVTATASSIAEAPLETGQADVVIVDQPSGSPRVDRAVTDAICARAPRANVALLDTLKSLSVGEFLGVVKAIASNQPVPSRHLEVVRAGNVDHDLRELLSDRELQVVRLVAEGISNKEISLRLALSDKTVKNHISHILAKLGLTARTQVAVHAIRTGFV